MIGEWCRVSVMLLTGLAESSLLRTRSAGIHVSELEERRGCVVHLTMFGVNLPDVEEEIRTKEKILVIVGAEKVPGDLYQLADYNVAVTNQPHSEIAGLAVFLDHIAENALHRDFPGAKVRVHPNPCGKTVEEL
jgi:tRNA (cytidine56-2'-O)-methyltransferase